jgi:phosphoglycolate phosphatase
LNEKNNIPEAIIFDWDDTLASNWQSIHEALNATLMAMGHETWPIDKTRANVHRALRESFPEMFGDSWEKAADIFYDHIRSHHLQTLKSLDFAAEILEQITAAGIMLGIVSNKTGYLLRAECEHLGWSKYFTAIIGAQDAVKDKPAPDPIYLCLEGTKIKPSRNIWYVGDAPTDLECAYNANLTAVLIRDSAITAEYERFPPHHHFENLNKMATFLDNLKQTLLK